MAEKIKCLICGLEFKRVCAHVRQVHGMSAREYKEEFGLDVKKGILTDEDREIMRRHALANKMDEQLRAAGAKTRFKKGQKGLGKYKRSQQTMARLKKNTVRRGDAGVRAQITCAYCGNVFDVVMSNTDQKYCSQRCYFLKRNGVWRDQSA